MTSYYIGADYCGVGEGSAMNKIAATLRSKGHSVTVGGIGPNQEGAAHGVSKDKTFLFVVCGVAPATIWSFKAAVAAGSAPKTIFVHMGWTSHQSDSPMHSESQMLNYSFIPEFDSGQFMTSSSTAAMKKDAGDAKTVGEYAKKYSQYIGVCWGSSPEDAANKIMSGQVTGYGGSGSYSGNSSSTTGGQTTDNVSPLLKGDMTFEELVGEICNGIDLLFLTKRTTVVVDDFESIYAQAKYLRDNNKDVVKGENISLWQLEEDSYELEVNQHGFYNTVYVTYKDGQVKESYDEYVRVYGEIPITYNDSKLDKTSAIMKAKAYLAAHVRDFNMNINLSMLTDGDIDIGDIVTVENPMTMNNEVRISEGRDPEYLFVNGVNTSWEGDSYIATDLELKLAPVSPKKLDVPASGTATGTANSSDGDSSSSSSGSYSKCGVSSDKKTICAIGKASASGEGQYGNNFYRSIFKNKCPFCGGESLVWGIFWAGNESSNYGRLDCKGSSEGGSAEGHIFCKSCDADFSCILGKDHTSPPKATLTRADSGPVKCTKEDAYKLKNGTYST